MPLATLAYYTFDSSNLGNCLPCELVFGRRPKLLLDLETDPAIKISGMYRDYHMLLSKRLQYLCKLLQDFRMKRLVSINKDRDFFQYNIGDLVYINSPLTSQLRTTSRKIAIKHIGLSADLHIYLLITLDGKLLKGLFEHERLKPAVIRTN